MLNQNLNFWYWWRNIWDASKYQILYLELWILLYSDCDEIIPGKVTRAIARTKLRYPDRSSIWYLEQTLEDVRNRTIYVEQSCLSKLTFGCHQNERSNG